MELSSGETTATAVAMVVALAVVVLAVVATDLVVTTTGDMEVEEITGAT